MRPGPGVTASAPDSSRRARWTVFLLVVAVTLAFSFYTRHVWEDFYITYRASKNLATGHGLTFTAGERVHSFTSPLGVLLPALASLLTGNSSDTAALWIFRLMSIAAYGATAVLAWVLARRLFPLAYPAVLLVALIATDAKSVDFTINGMETPYLLLFLVWTLYALFTAPERRAVHLGLAWAGLMWSRPDSFIYIGVLAVGAFLFGRFSGPTPGRGAFLRDCLLGGLITTALYGPWLLWAWWYYGSPIPHTVVAKGLLGPYITPSNVWIWLKDFPVRIYHTGADLGITFMPGNAMNDATTGWPHWAGQVSRYLTLGIMLLWLIPWARWEARVASFAVMVGQFYLTYFMTFPAPWYIPTVTFLAAVAWVVAFGQMVAWMRRAGRDGTLVRGVRALLVGVSFLVPLGALALLVCTAIQMRWAQEINETGNRRVMGEWLKAQSSSSKETVFVECLGYIGFFSNLKMYDFPGLCSPEVVAARRKCPLMGNYPNYFPQLISDLEPDWVVLRASEIYLMSQVNRDVLARYYHLARVFDTKARIDAVRFLPGRGYLLFDSHFEIYRRNDAPGGPAGARVHIPAIAVPIMVENLTVRDTWAGPAYNSQGRIAAHASSRLVATVPARATTVAGEYGFFPGAYEGANGALFSIDVVSKSGTKTRIFSAPLDPKAKPGDRGDRPFSAPLTMTDAATVEFLIAPPPGQSNAFGWTYWTNLKFEIPK